MATKQQQQDFLKIIAPFAIAEMENSGILASVIIAQAILESCWGLSTATRLGCNLFGIKADCNWKGQFVTATGWEEDKKGNKTYYPMRWRKYNSWAESIKDHSLFLKAKRYSNIIGDKDYKSVANKLKLDGYATSVNYSQQLISIIEQYQLYKYDTPKGYTITFKPSTEGECKTIQNWVHEKANYNGEIKNCGTYWSITFRTLKDFECKSIQMWVTSHAKYNGEIKAVY